MTQLLLEAGRGDRAANEALFERVYDELRGLAKNRLRDERPDHTLQPTALVHETYLRLFGGQQIAWENRAQFFSMAAQVMRHILVDHARKQGAEKRGGGERKLSLDRAIKFADEQDVNLIALDEALERLKNLDQEQSSVVELRFFGGLSIKEIADVLRVSEATVSRKWNTAKLWLHDQLNSESAE